MAAAPPSLSLSTEMKMIHRIFRREFVAMPELVRGVRAGDVARARAVGDGVQLMLLGLHVHHSGEDALLWPKLLDRATPSADVVHRMESQHEAVAELVGKAELQVTGWLAAAGTSERDALAATLDELRAPLLVHLDEEEQQILPLAEEHIAPEEWNQLAEHGRNGFPKSKQFIQLGTILEDATPQERAGFLAKLPTPVVLLWHVLGKRQHAKYVRKVRGKAA
jgi:hypothetical protein